MLFGSQPGWVWAAIPLLLALGAAGLMGKRSLAMELARAAAIAVTALLVSWFNGGYGSPMTVWFVITGLVYPVIVARSWGWILLPATAALYLPLGLSSANRLSVWTSLVRVAMVTVAAYLVWGLRSSSERLAGDRERAETELRRVRDRFEVAFADSSSGMAMIELSGEINQTNQAFADFLGRDLAELEGINWTDLIDPEDRSRIELATALLTAAEIWSYQEEVRFIGRPSKTVWGLLGVAAVTNDDGEPLYLFAHVQDITGRVAGEVQLRRNEQHYRNLFQNSPIPIWEADYTGVAEWLEGFRAEGVTDIAAHLRYRSDLVRFGLNQLRFIDVNDAALELLEAESVDELASGLVVLLARDGSLSAVIDQFVAIWNDGERAQSDVEAETFRGRTIEGVLHWVAPTVEGHRDLSKVTVAFADITQYRAAEEALQRIEERLRAVVAAAPILLFALDERGVFTLSEGQALATLGLAPGEAVGRSTFELFRDSPEMIAAVRRALAGESFTTSIEVADRGFDARLSPIWEEGRVAGVIGVANDVTDRKRATEQLELLVRTKDEFVAGVSHELRTPLTAVVGFAQELRDGVDRFSREDLETLIHLIAEQSIEVADLVEDLLVAARADVDAVAIASEAVDLREQVELVLLAWPPEEEARVDKSEASVKAYSDPVRLRQILRNLLSNAQRYGGDKIRVELIDGGEQVFVRVLDNGVGIPVRDRDRVFEPYFRAHESRGLASSVGLGLTVSRQLARLMDGDLSYRYEDGWSVFDLVLPSA
jgi:PAS domain S-box-containing protein